MFDLRKTVYCVNSVPRPRVHYKLENYGLKTTIYGLKKTIHGYEVISAEK